jgi:hypothetical protein
MNLWDSQHGAGGLLLIESSIQQIRKELKNVKSKTESLQSVVEWLCIEHAAKLSYKTTIMMYITVVECLDIQCMQLKQSISINTELAYLILDRRCLLK